MKLLDKIAFKLWYIKIQRPTENISTQQRKSDIKTINVTGEFPIDVYRHTVATELITKLGEAMLPYVQEESYFNKEQRISRFTWTIKFLINNN